MTRHNNARHKRVAPDDSDSDLDVQSRQSKIQKLSDESSEDEIADEGPIEISSGEDDDEEDEEEDDSELDSEDERAEAIGRGRRELRQRVQQYVEDEAFSSDEDNSEEEEFERYGSAEPFQIGFSVAKRMGLRPLEDPWAVISSENGESKKVPNSIPFDHPDYIYKIPMEWHGHPIPAERSFHPFPKLPMEIKIMIWKHTFPEATGRSRILDFAHLPEAKWPLVSNGNLRWASMGLRVMMSIHRELRNLAKATYRTTLAVDGDGLVWINPEKDIIMLVGIASKTPMDLWRVSHSISSKIINLALEFDTPHNGIVRNSELTRAQRLLYYLNFFPNLKRVFLQDDTQIKDPRVLEWAGTHKSITTRHFDCEENEIGEFSHRLSLMTWPDVWDCAEELGIKETQPSPEQSFSEDFDDENEVKDKGNGVRESIIGAGSEHLEKAFIDFVKCAENIGHPRSLPQRCNWETLKNLKFYPILDLSGATWPLRVGHPGSIHLIKRTPDALDYSWLRSRTHTAKSLRVSREQVREVFDEELGGVSSDEEPDEATEIVYSEYEFDSDPLDPVVEDDDNESIGGVGEELDGPDASDSETNVLSVEEEDMENQSDNDFIVGDDDELEYTVGDILPDDSDIEGGDVVDTSPAQPRKPRRRLGPRETTGYTGVLGLRQRAIVIDSDSEEDGDDESIAVVPAKQRRARNRVALDSSSDGEGESGNVEDAVVKVQDKRRIIVSSDSDE